MFIEPIHTAVPGRGRFKVKGLRGSPYLKLHLETVLARQAGVVDARASVNSGNLLIRFDLSVDHAHAAEWIMLGLESAAVAMDRAQQVPNDVAPGKDVVLRPPSTADVQMPPAAPVPAVVEDDRKVTPWHSFKKERILTTLKTDAARGLLPVETARRLKRHGPNSLPEAEKRSGWSIFFDQINSLPNYLLGAAAGVSVLTGGVLDAAVVAGVVGANALIGYFTESEAEKTIHSLRRFVQPTAEVIRDGVKHQIPAAEVVPGDMVELKPGVYVPADCRLLKARHLSIDESMLTGESMPVNKHTKAIPLQNTPLADRTNMAYMGTLVTGGEGLAVVVATGRETEIGHLQELLAGTETPITPIERQLHELGDQLVIMCCAVCGLVGAVGLLRGYGLLTMLRTAISLAAAAVPEGLPAAATINFALGISKMKEHRVLVRKLQAIETLGALQTICLDKTGTLTLNQMTVTRILVNDHDIELEDGRFLDGETVLAPLDVPEMKLLTECALLCHEVKLNGYQDGQPVLLGSATEVALIRMGAAAGLDLETYARDYELTQVKHRSEKRLYMSTLHTAPDGRQLYYVKGSPPEVIGLCGWQMRNGELVELDDLAEMALERHNDRMAGQGLRVLGMAFLSAEPGAKLKKANGNLIWLGLVGMIDPIRPSAREMIRAFHKAGIDTVMITGDQSPTAYAVAHQLDISGDRPLEILDSSELTAVRGEVLAAVARQVDVYSRVSPAHKLKIVQAVQSGAKVVGMTGDGINDGPALKAADIGIAMGRSGTDIAREVADVVLEKDNLETLIKAVEDGRATYANIRKSVNFFLATNMSEVMVMSTAMALGIGFPLNVLQLMWINIISDIFPGLALSMEAPEPDILERRPRPSGAPLFDKDDFRRMAGQAGIMTTSTLAAYAYGLSRYGMGPRAGAMAFQTLTTGQLLHAFACRSSSRTAGHKLPPNKYLNYALGGSLLLQALTMVVPPLRNLLGLAPLGLVDLAVVGAASVAPLAIIESTKTQKR